MKCNTIIESLPSGNKYEKMNVQIFYNGYNWRGILRREKERRRNEGSERKALRGEG